jgi:hypothetical protein
MGISQLFGMEPEDNIRELVWEAPNEETITRIKKEISKILAKKLYYYYIICGVAGFVSILMPIGMFRQGFELKSLFTTLATFAICGLGIYFIIKKIIPKKKLIISNFREGLYEVCEIDPTQLSLRIMRDGKETQHGSIKYLKPDSTRASLDVEFMPHDVKTFHKKRKELTRVQIIRIADCEEIYGFLYFERKGFFY